MPKPVSRRRPRARQLTKYGFCSQTYGRFQSCAETLRLSGMSIPNPFPERQRKNVVCIVLNIVAVPFHHDTALPCEDLGTDPAGATGRTGTDPVITNRARVPPNHPGASGKLARGTQWGQTPRVPVARGDSPQWGQTPRSPTMGTDPTGLPAPQGDIPRNPQAHVGSKSFRGTDPKSPSRPRGQAPCRKRLRTQGTILRKSLNLGDSGEGRARGMRAPAAPGRVFSRFGGHRPGARGARDGRKYVRMPLRGVLRAGPLPVRREELDSAHGEARHPP